MGVRLSTKKNSAAEAPRPSVRDAVKHPEELPPGEPNDVIRRAPGVRAVATAGRIGPVACPAVRSGPIGPGPIGPAPVRSGPVAFPAGRADRIGPAGPSVGPIGPADRACSCFHSSWENSSELDEVPPANETSASTLCSLLQRNGCAATKCGFALRQGYAAAFISRKSAEKCRGLNRIGLMMNFSCPNAVKGAGPHA